MSKQWYDYPVTQAHGNGESGIDLGTPDKTPVYFPDAGAVIDAEMTTYGGQVVIFDGQELQYFIHLNDFQVKPGEAVQAGQVVGHTGGGVGDMVLHNGTVQPAQDQSWFVVNGKPASSGPHVEYGIFEGKTLSDFNADWTNPNKQDDPTNEIWNAVHNGSLPNVTTNAANVLQAAWSQFVHNVSSNDLTGTTGAINAANPIAGLQSWVAANGSRVGMFALGGAVILVGLIVFIKPSVPGL